MSDLVKKWTLTGLLDGLEEGEGRERGSEVLEKTAQQLLLEYEKKDREGWKDIALCLIIKIFAKTGKSPNYNLVELLYRQVKNLTAGSHICQKPNIAKTIEKLVCELYIEKNRSCKCQTGLFSH